MKKYLASLLFFFLFTSPLHADKLLKSGFLSGEWKLDTNFNINNPADKIIIIYNHGSAENDKPSKDCVWKNNIRNWTLLSKSQVKKKEILVYSLCSDHLGGDDWKIFWKKKNVQYKGTPKLEKRVQANFDIIEKFINLGVPNNQIFLAGQSCGGWTTMMFLSKYPNKIAGGITTEHACYGKLSRKYKVEKVGVDKALKNFKKKRPVAAFFRSSQIKMISEAKNLPVLIFTHPKDPFDGLLSDWVDNIPGAKRIVMSENFKINNKSCKRIGVNNGERWEEPIKARGNSTAHHMSMADCFQYYNPTILEFIASKIK